MRNWLAIASADHVEIGKRDGFMQVCHGKGGPLRRLSPGDRVFYYSPSRTYGMKDGLMSFTACGLVAGTAPYRFDMGGGFVPFRLDVRWLAAEPVPIRPHLDALELTRGKSNWAYPFRYGLLPLTEADGRLLAALMGAEGAPEGVLPARRSPPESPQFQLF